jgi:hypothetical protein
MRGRLLGAIAAIVVAAGIAQAQAVTLHSGGSATYNFDFTGHSPPPPYPITVNTFFALSGVDAGEAATFAWFDGLGGTGASVKTQVDDPLDAYLQDLGGQNGVFFMGLESGILDGVFSIVVTADRGTFNIDSAVAGAANSGGFWILDTAGDLVAVNDVPEPGSLALLGGGLAAVVALRRRHRVIANA